MLCRQSRSSHGCGRGPLEPQGLVYFQLHTRCRYNWRVDLTPIIVPHIGAVPVVKTNNLWVQLESAVKSNFLIQILSHALALEIFFWCHIVITNKIELKKVKLWLMQPSNYTLYCNWASKSICGYVYHQCTSSLLALKKGNQRKVTKESELRLLTMEMVIVCRRTFQLLLILVLDFQVMTSSIHGSCSCDITMNVSLFSAYIVIYLFVYKSGLLYSRDSCFNFWEGFFLFFLFSLWRSLCCLSSSSKSD